MPSGDLHLLTVLGAVAGILVLYQLAATFLRAHLLLRLRTVLDTSMTIGFLEHLVARPYGFFLKRSPGDLMMRLRSNTTVREILTTGALGLAARRRTGRAPSRRHPCRLPGAGPARRRAGRRPGRRSAERRAVAHWSNLFADHAELLARGAGYADLVRAQFGSGERTLLSGGPA